MREWLALIREVIDLPDDGRRQDRRRVARLVRKRKGR